MAQATSQADELLRRLLQDGRKVSYIGAYEILLGSRPKPWWHRKHCREVLDIALQSTPQVHEGLTIQLDALIVNQGGTQEPSDGYFTNRAFTREDWRRVFGDWPLQRARDTAVQIRHPEA
jgi:hypothetical protein